MKFFQSVNNWVKKSITIKLITIGFLMLVLLIPTLMMGGIVKERERTQDKAINEVSSKWGESQRIVGPILTIPYRYYNTNKKVTVIEEAHFLPEKLNVEGDIITQILNRGIYDVVVYNSDLKINGSFDAPDFSEWNVASDNILWNDSYVSLGITDMRGIQETIKLSWGNKDYDFNPGVRSTDIIKSGMTSLVKINKDNLVENSFSFELKLNGSQDISFIPLGKTTSMNLKSDWPSPSFDGDFLPDNRSVTAEGFEADWKILDLNRNYPQKWLGNNYKVNSSTFGVELLVPVDQYQQTDRSIKYALMIILLTFVVFFFVEVLLKTRIHPFQYILVGVALIIFYALLLSLSEHISFGISYLIAGIAVTTLISLYARTVFKKDKLAILLAVILVILYSFVYFILQLEDYALLLGSVFLFVILAIIMYLSKNIKWYREEDNIVEIKDENN